KADVEDVLAQIELIQQFVDESADPLGTIGVLVADAAEEDIVEHARRAIVGLGIVTFDRSLELWRKSFVEGGPRLYDASHEVAIEKAKAMTRLDVREGEPDDAVAIALRDLGKRPILQLLAVRLVIGNLICRHAGQLLDE